MKQITIVCCLLALLSFDSFSQQLDSVSTKTDESVTVDLTPILISIFAASTGVSHFFRAYKLRQDAIIASSEHESIILRRRSDRNIIYGTILSSIAVISFNFIDLPHKNLYLSTNNFGLNVDYKF